MEYQNKITKKISNICTKKHSTLVVVTIAWPALPVNPDIHASRPYGN
jgi:hypothetical protein